MSMLSSSGGGSDNRRRAALLVFLYATRILSPVSTCSAEVRRERGTRKGGGRAALLARVLNFDR
jgi:hypothetical protein